MILLFQKENLMSLQESSSFLSEKLEKNEAAVGIDLFFTCHKMSGKFIKND